MRRCARRVSGVHIGAAAGGQHRGPSASSRAITRRSPSRNSASPRAAKISGMVIPAASLDLVVGIGERQPQARGQPAPDRALARAHHAHEHDRPLAKRLSDRGACPMAWDRASWYPNSRPSSSSSPGPQAGLCRQSPRRPLAKPGVGLSARHAFPIRRGAGISSVLPNARRHDRTEADIGFSPSRARHPAISAGCRAFSPAASMAACWRSSRSTSPSRARSPITIPASRLPR